MRCVPWGLGLVLSGISFCAMGAVYKWVDNDGNTHFSQTPPTKNDQVHSSAKLDAHLGSAAIEAVQNGNKVFCGRLQVMDVNISDEILVENIRLSIDDWSKQRQKIDQKRRGNHQLEQRYAEYDCRVRWGYRKLQTLRSFKYQANKEYDALQQEYNRLKERQEKECSTDPEKLGKTMLVGREADEWGKCYNHYKYKMRDVKTKINENRKSLSDVIRLKR